MTVEFAGRQLVPEFRRAAFDRIEKRPPCFRPAHGQSLEWIEPGEWDACTGNITQHQRIKTGSETSRILARRRKNRHECRRIEVHGGIGTPRRRPDLLDDGSERGEIEGGRWRVCRTPGMVMAGQGQVRRRAVIGVFMRHAADDCQPIGNASGLRQMFAEVEPRNGC